VHLRGPRSRKGPPRAAVHHRPPPIVFEFIDDVGRNHDSFLGPAWTALILPPPPCGLLRLPANFRVRRILRRPPPRTIVFPQKNPIVRCPTRGAFFAGRRAGSHGAATTTADGRSSTVKEPPSRPLLARSCEPADCDST
jgi:hypothetical protein